MRMSEHVSKRLTVSTSELARQMIACRQTGCMCFPQAFGPAGLCMQNAKHIKQAKAIATS